MESGAEHEMRLALRKGEAACALGVSDEFFDEHIRPSMPVVRVGSLRLYAIEDLRAWLAEHAEIPLGGR